MREELDVSAWPDLLAVMQQSAPVAQISQLHGLQTYYGELDIRGGHCCSSCSGRAIALLNLMPSAGNSLPTGWPLLQSSWWLACCCLEEAGRQRTPGCLSLFRRLWLMPGPC